MPILLESVPEVRNDLTESQILEEIKQLNRHIIIVEEVIEGLKKTGPIYTQESYKAIINRYREMYDNALQERSRYREVLKRFQLI